MLSKGTQEQDCLDNLSFIINLQPAFGTGLGHGERLAATYSEDLKSYKAAALFFFLEFAATAIGGGANCGSLLGALSKGSSCLVDVRRILILDTIDRRLTNALCLKI